MAVLPRRWPLVPTLLVALAALVMMSLGVWQLDRRTQKEAMIALISANPGKPPVAFPERGPVAPEMLYRRSSVLCTDVENWTKEGGRAADGSMGFRYIARCRTGSGGTGALVELGVSDRPDLTPGWAGGEVHGWVAQEPDHRSLLSHLTGPEIILRPMLVAEASPVAGWKAPAPPNIDNIPNNHLSYAVQWFAFALIALVIYTLALKRRESNAAGDS